MKKLYKKGTVHPTPPTILDQLSFLPAAILTLTIALSSQDREVLAYLLSCYSNNNSKNTTHKTAPAAGGAQPCSGGDHPPSFNCSCFRCYTSYWARWDASPNQRLIHDIIDAFEEGLVVQGKKEKGRKERRRNRGTRGSAEFRKSELGLVETESGESDPVEESSTGGGGGEDGEGEEAEVEKSSVRKLVSFLGEKIWGVWN